MPEPQPPSLNALAAQMAALNAIAIALVSSLRNPSEVLEYFQLAADQTKADALALPISEEFLSIFDSHVASFRQQLTMAISLAQKP